MKHITLATCLLTVISGSAYAQPRSGVGADADVDADGRISALEFSNKSQEQFARLDADNDGYLTVEEMRSARGQFRRGGRGNSRQGRDGLGRGRFGEQLDSDGDGSLSLAEIQTARPEMTAERFMELDSNGDGLLNRDDRAQRRAGSDRRN